MGAGGGGGGGGADDEVGEESDAADAAGPCAFNNAPTTDMYAKNTYFGIPLDTRGVVLLDIRVQSVN